LVWLMQAFESSNMANPPEFLSDHPSDVHRVQALQSEFASDPALFSNFNPNKACGTPLTHSGFYDQYRGGCGAVRQQSYAPHKRSGTHRISPVSAATKPPCPRNWKYC
jgi:hypothetical protein